MAEILSLAQFKAWKNGGPAASEKEAGATIQALHEALLVTSYPVKEEDVKRSYGTIQALRDGGWMR